MSSDPYDFDPSDTGGDYLATGKHVVTITDHELCEAKTGTPQIALTFDDGSRTHREYFALTEKARWRLANVFTACGWTSKIRLSDPGMVKKAIYNKPLSIVLYSDEYQGKTITKLDVSKIAASSRRPNPAPAPDTSRDEEAPPPGDQDIPF